MRQPYSDPVPALKRQLAGVIVERMDGYEQYLGGSFLDIDGARLSNLRKGRLERFSLQALVRMLARLGDEVTIANATYHEVRMREVHARRKQREAEYAERAKCAERAERAERAEGGECAECRKCRECGDRLDAPRDGSSSAQPTDASLSSSSRSAAVATSARSSGGRSGTAP